MMTYCGMSLHQRMPSNYLNAGVQAISWRTAGRRAVQPVDERDA